MLPSYLINKVVGTVGHRGKFIKFTLSTKPERIHCTTEITGRITDSRDNMTLPVCIRIANINQ